MTLAIYCSGLDVECILRAIRWMKEPSFDGRYDLEDLFKASDFLGFDEARMRANGLSLEDNRGSFVGIRAVVDEIFILWHNNLRFCSEASRRAFLRHNGRLQGIKGDALKKNSSDLLIAAQTVIDRGVVLWMSRKK